MTKLKNFVFIIVFVLITTFILGCSSSTNSVVSNDNLNTQKQNSIIPDSIKVEKQDANNVLITYKTSVPIQKSNVITSNFSFNNVPLWSKVYNAQTSDGINHKAIVSTNDAKYFMIYAGPSNKYDNNGKGIKIE